MPHSVKSLTDAILEGASIRNIIAKGITESKIAPEFFVNFVSSFLAQARDSLGINADIANSKFLPEDNFLIITTSEPDGSLLSTPRKRAFQDMLRDAVDSKFPGISYEVVATSNGRTRLNITGGLRKTHSGIPIEDWRVLSRQLENKLKNFVRLQAFDDTEIGSYSASIDGGKVRFSIRASVGFQGLKNFVDPEELSNFKTLGRRDDSRLFHTTPTELNAKLESYVQGILRENGLSFGHLTVAISYNPSKGKIPGDSNQTRIIKFLNRTFNCNARQLTTYGDDTVAYVGIYTPSLVIDIPADYKLALSVTAGGEMAALAAKADSLYIHAFRNSTPIPVPELTRDAVIAAFKKALARV